MNGPAIAPHRTDPASGRSAEALLRFAPAGGRTVLSRQHVPYPFHITRPFRLDAARPDLATLYLQSASGGLYRGDRLRLDIAAEAGSAVHLTTQSATIVNDAEGIAARQALRLDIGAGAFAAVTMDPLVLLPGADLHASIEAVLHEDGALILADGFACHDPTGAGRRFERLRLETRLLRPDGALLLADAGVIEAADLGRPHGPLGAHHAAGTMLVAAPSLDVSLLPAMEQCADGKGCLAGATRLPNGAGIAARLLAPDGGTLARGLDALFVLAAEALLGFSPAPRRK